jgi:8-oxo-dGTP pyrophosphatase MutT (NUDIX family)
VAALFSPNATAAAVLLPVIDHPGGPTLLFTERASMLKHHAGQIAFPGGRVEPEDGSALAGALRETAEEIGLLPSNIEVLGYLPEHPVISGYCVTPVVGLVTPGFRLTPDPREVASVFEVPLDYLLQPANCVLERRKIGGVVEVLLQEFQWQERRIWGATASMVLLLAEALRQGHVAHA